MRKVDVVFFVALRSLMGTSWFTGRRLQPSKRGLWGVKELIWIDFSFPPNPRRRSIKSRILHNVLLTLSKKSQKLVETEIYLWADPANHIKILTLGRLSRTIGVFITGNIDDREQKDLILLCLIVEFCGSCPRLVKSTSNKMIPLCTDQFLCNFDEIYLQTRSNQLYARISQPGLSSTKYSSQIITHRS